MPAFNLKCAECGASTRRLARTFLLVNLTCDTCGGKLQRDPHGPSAQVMESLDNGLMPRRVERLRDAERLMKERSQNADPLAGVGKRQYDD